MNNPDNESYNLPRSEPALWIGNNLDRPDKEIDTQFTYNPLELSIPSMNLRGTVSGPELDRFLYIGSAWTTLCSYYYPSSPNIEILDIGCGVGKMARFFAMSPHIKYVGFDIFLPAIEWCQFHFGPLYGDRFKFFHFDGHSNMYNPLGTINTTDYHFPCKENSMDIAIGASILTHLYENDIRHYLHQTSICLKPGGKAIFSTHTPDEFENFFPELQRDITKKIIGNEQVMMIDNDYFEELASEYNLQLFDRPGRLCGQEISIFQKS